MGGPTAADDVVLILANVNLDVSPTIQSLSVGNVAGISQLSFNAGTALTVTGNVLVTGPAATGTTLVAVGTAQLLIGGNLTLDGGVAGDARVTISTGLVDLGGSLVYVDQTPREQFALTAGGTLEIGGNLGAGGTFTAAANSTVVFDGAGLQTIPSVALHHVQVNKASGSVLAALAVFAFNGNLTIQSGTLDDNGNQIAGTVGGSVSLLSASSVLILRANWPFAGTPVPAGFIHPQSIVKYINGGNLFSTAYGNLVVESQQSVPPQPSRVASAGNLTVNGTLFLTRNAAGSLPPYLDLDSVPATEVFGDIADFGGLNGDLALGAGTLTLHGDFTSTGVFDPGTSTFFYLGAPAGVRPVRGTTYHNLVLNNAAADFQAAGPIVANDGAFTASSFGIGANTLQIARDVTINTTVNGTGLITIGASGSQISGVGTVNPPVQLQPTTGRTFVAGTDLTFAGTFTTNVSITNNGTVRLTNLLGPQGAALWTQGANSTLTLAGSFAGTVNLDATSAGNTVAYLSAAQPQQVKAGTYHHLTIDKAGQTATLAAPILVNGDLTVVAGTLADGGNQITGNAAGTVAIGMPAGVAALVLGGAPGPTLFPTNYLTGGIQLGPNSVVSYDFNGAQTVSSLPTYATLRLRNAGSPAAKTPSGASLVVTVQTDVGNLASLTLAMGASDLTTGFLVGSGALTFTTGSIFLSESWNHTGAFTPGTGTATYSGGNAANVRSQSYNNLTISGGGATGKSALGPLDVNGDFSIGAAGRFVGGAFTHTVAGSWSNTGTFVEAGTTIHFDGVGAGTQTIGASVFEGLTFSGNRTKAAGGAWQAKGNVTINPGATVQGSTFSHTIGGSWANTGTFTPQTSTVTFQSLAGLPRTVSASAFNNVTFGSPGSYTLTGALNVTGNLFIGGPAAVVTTAFPILLGGGFSNSGTFTANVGSVVDFNGGALQTIGGTVDTAFLGMTTSGAGGVAMVRNATVNGVLTLGAGRVDTGVNVLTLGASASFTRTTGHVNGAVARVIPGSGTFVFPTGNAVGYFPVDLNVNGGAGTFTVRLVSTPHPARLANNVLQAYWTLSPGGITDANILFGWPVGAVVGNENNYVLGRFDLGIWSYPGFVSPPAHTAGASEVSQFTTDWTVGEPTSLGGASTHLVLTGPASATAGTPFNVTIQAADAFGNPDVYFAGDHTLVFAGAGVASPGVPRVLDKNGVARGFGQATVLTFAGGVANATVTLFKAETANLAATADGSLPTNTPLAVAVSPAGLNSFVFNATSPQTVGVAFTGTNTLRAVDAYGNTLIAFDASANAVTFTALAPLSGTLSFTAGGNVLSSPTDFVAGIADLTALGLKYAGTNGTGTVRATSATGKTGGASIAFNPGAPSTLVVTGPASAAAGTPVNATVTARDVAGNVATAYTGDRPITFAGAGSSPSPATAPTVSSKTGVAVPFGSPTTLSFLAGVASVSGASNGVLTLYKAESAAITATDGVLPAGTPLAIAVGPGPHARFDLALATPQASGQPFTGPSTLTASDAFGNPITTYDASTNNVTLTASAPLTGTISGLGTAGTNVLDRATDFVTGVANLAALGMRYTGPTGTGTFTAVSQNPKTGTSNPVTIVAGPATKLAITSVNGGASPQATVAFPVVVQVQDSAGNPASVAADTNVTLVRQTGTGTLSGTTTGTVLAGQSSVTLPGVGYGKAETGVSLRADAAGLTSGISATFTVLPGPPANLAVTINGGASPQAGNPFYVVVESRDAAGNPSNVPLATSITLSRSTGTAPLTGTLTGMLAAGTSSATFPGLRYDKAETLGITATVSSGTPLTPGTATTTVLPSGPTKLSVALGASPITNTDLPLVVTVRDAFDNATPVNGPTSVSVSLESGTGTLTGTLGVTIPAAASSVTTNIAYSKAEAGVVFRATWTGGGSPLAFGLTPPYTFTSGAPYRAIILMPGETFDPTAPNGRAGVAQDQISNLPFTAEIHIVDAANNPITAGPAASAVVAFTSNDPSATLPGPTTLAAGQATVSATLRSLGPGRVITCTIQSISGGPPAGVVPDTSTPVAVVIGPLHHFMVEAAGGGAIAPQTAGVPFGLKLTAQDAAGNTVTAFGGTVQITSNGAISPLGSQPFASGVLVSQSVTITSAQTGTTVSVTDLGSGATGTSNAFTVNPAGLGSFLVEAAAGGTIAPQTAGVPFGIRVRARDAFGNPIPTFTGTVSLSTTAGTISPPSLTFLAADLGVATANVTVTQAGTNRTITATAPGAAGTSNAFTVNAAGAGSFLVESSGGGSIGPQTAGTPFAIRVTARDAFGNTAAGYTGTVSLSTTAGAISPLTLAFAAADQGSKTVSVTVTQSGIGKTITAVDGPLTGTSNSFTVNSGAVASFHVSAPGGASIPAQTAGTSFPIEIVALDLVGNVVTGFSGTVNVTSNGNLTQGGGTSAPFVNGVLAHIVSIGNAGTFSITATRTGGSESGTSNAFTVTGGGGGPVFDLTLTKTHTGSFTVGQPGVFTLTVTNVGGAAAAGPITITDTLPTGLGFSSFSGAGWSCSAAVNVVTCTHAGTLAALSSSTLTLTVSVAAAAVPQVVNTAAVSAAGETSTSNNTASDLTSVLPQPSTQDFAITVNPSSRVLPAGGSGGVLVSALSLGGFAGVVSFTSSAPGGLSIQPATFSLPAGNGQGVIVNAGAAAPGTYTVLFHGNATVSGVPTQRTALLTVTITGAPDFGLLVNPGLLTVAPGGAGTVSVQTQGVNGYSGLVTVNAPSLPGITFTPSTFTVAAGGLSNVNVAVAAGTASGPQSAVFTATGAGVAGTRSAGFTLDVVPPPDFSLTAAPSSLALTAAGAAGTLSVTAQGSGGFAASISVSAPAVPNVTFTPSTFTLTPGGSQIVSVAAAAGAAPGTATLAFTGTAAPGTRTASFSLTVAAPPTPTIASFTATPASLVAGASSTLAWTSTNADTATIDHGVGNVPPSGSTIVTPAATTTYLLTVTGPGGSATASVTVNVCPLPGAPLSPQITPQGNPSGPLTGSDILVLSWGAPSSGATRYEYRINGEPYTSTTSLTAIAPPRGSAGAIQLFVRAYNCSPEIGPGPEASSVVYSLAAPVASFSAPATAVINTPVTLTDTSVPQATSWVWLFDDGTLPGTGPSQVHTWKTLGAHTVILIASNGSGSSTTSKTINVVASSPTPARPGPTNVRAVDGTPDPARHRLAAVTVGLGRKVTLSLSSLLPQGESVVYLRLLDGAGSLAVERRLVVPALVETVLDLGAFGLEGVHTLELVSSDRLTGFVVEELTPIRR